MSERAKILVFCERIDNESFCESIVRELEAYYEVRAFGPGWPREDWNELDAEGARFYLELDSASGRFDRPRELERLNMPKFAWFVDTHKKPDYHRGISRAMDLTFYAMKNWGHVLEGRTAWLPLHADTRIFRPQARERDLDITFVGSYGWRAEPILKIAAKHGLRAHVECTTGPLEKTQTAELYARSKLVFNRHVANDLNFRVFEATACGRVLLTDAQWNGQYDLLRSGEHLVYYSDEQDLEEKILTYLRDDDARMKIEQAAADHSARHHSTRARVAELRATIESFLAERGGRVVPASVREAKRWLVFADAEPVSVSRESYGERLAHALTARGDEVALAREKRGALPAAESSPVLELEGTRILGREDSNGDLARASALHSRLVRATRELHFDGVIGEGALGALVAQPIAARRKIPFVFALEDCEVRRRSNRLSREQLYWAEVEEWGVERASLVLVPRPESIEAAKRFYRARSVEALDPPPSSLERPRGGERLLRQLGLEQVPYVALLGREVSEAGARKILATTATPTLLLTATDTWLRAGGPPLRVWDRPARGAALGSLLVNSQLVVALDGADERAHEARALGCRVHGTPPRSESVALDRLDAVFAAAPERELLHAI